MVNAKTVVLARVSSKAQEDESYSLDAQLKLIRRYCNDKKLDVISEFRISETASKNEQRTVFRQMLQYVNKNNVTHLVVEKTDRLTRNLRDAVVIDDWLAAYGEGKPCGTQKSQVRRKIDVEHLSCVREKVHR